MRKFKATYGIALAVLLIGSIVVINSGVFAGKKEQAPSAGTALSVKVVEAQYVDTVPGIALNGSLEGRTSATISAKLAGRIEQIMVEEGQQVKAGDALIKMETVELANSARQAQDGVRKAQANYELALNDFSRYQTLYDKGAVSEQQLDNAKAKLKTAEADLSSAQSSQSSAEEQYGYGVITAPVDGVIANKTATVGQVVSPGASLMMVQDINQVYAVVNVEQKDLGRVKTGQKANVTVDAYPGKVFAGTVDVMNPEAGSASRTFRTKIRLENAGGDLKAGMFAKVQLETGESVKVLAVPQSAVVQKQNLYYVFTVDNNVAVRRQIEIGEVSGNTITVTAGLQPGEQVIISSVNRINDADTVRVAQ
jgi:RND family efflux transporter MFP subunit